MHAEDQGDDGHDDEGRQATSLLGPGLPDKHDPHGNRQDQETKIQPVAGRQGERFAADFAAQFPKGDHRPGEGHRSDQDSQVDFDVVNGLLGVGEVVRPFEVKKGGKAHQDRREPHQAVQNRDQFRHLGHLHAAGQQKSHRPAGHQSGHQEGPIAFHRSPDGGEQGNQHPGNSADISATGGFLVTQPPQGENEENDGSQVGNVG